MVNEHCTHNTESCSNIFLGFFVVTWGYFFSYQDSDSWIIDFRVQRNIN